MLPALEVLRQLQEAAFRDQRLRPEDVQLPTLPGRMRAALAAAGWSDAQLSECTAPHERRQTPLENPQDFSIVETAVRSAIVALAAKPNSAAAVAESTQIVFGTIPTRDLMYSLVAVPGGSRPLLLFPGGVLTFAYLLLKCVALCFDYEERHEAGALRYSMNDSTDSAPASIPPAKLESGRRFHELFVAYAQCGTADMVPAYAAGPAATNLCTWIGASGTGLGEATFGTQRAGKFCRASRRSSRAGGGNRVHLPGARAIPSRGVLDARVAGRALGRRVGKYRARANPGLCTRCRPATG